MKLFITALLCLLPVTMACAQSVPMFGEDPANFFLSEPHDDHVWGWTFTVTSPIEVTHAAWYDEHGDGLSHSHLIGLWKQGVQLLGPIGGSGTRVGITVPAGTAAVLDGPWRRTALTAPLTLQTGNYALGGVDNVASTDTVKFRNFGDGANPIAGGRAQIGLGGYALQLGFRPPDALFLVPGIECGPMLFVSPVPEPTTAMLFATAMILGCCIVRGRK